MKKRRRSASKLFNRAGLIFQREINIYYDSIQLVNPKLDFVIELSQIMAIIEVDET